MVTNKTREDFVAELLDYINHALPKLDRRGRAWAPVDADTQLFATGLLDSMSIVHLITFVEQVRGEFIPDRLIVMKHFQTANAIADTFFAQ